MTDNHQLTHWTHAPPWTQRALRVCRSVQRNTARSFYRTAERHQAVAAQHQTRNVAVGAVFRIFEAKAAFKAEPAVIAAAQSQPGRVYGVIDQLDSSGAAGIATQQDGLFGRGAGCVPECERHRTHNHQYQ